MSMNEPLGCRAKGTLSCSWRICFSKKAKNRFQVSVLLAQTQHFYKIKAPPLAYFKSVVLKSTPLTTQSQRVSKVLAEMFPNGPADTAIYRSMLWSHADKSEGSKCIVFKVFLFAMVSSEPTLYNTQRSYNKVDQPQFHQFILAISSNLLKFMYNRLFQSFSVSSHSITGWGAPCLLPKARWDKG